MSTGSEVASAPERSYECGVTRALPGVLLVLCLAACESVVDPSNLPPPDRFIDTRPDEGFEPASDIPAESEMREEVFEDTIEDVHEDEAGVVEPCTLDLGTFTPGAERATFSTMDGFWVVQGAITTSFATDPYSFLDIESWSGPWSAGTYEVTGRVSTTSCTLCVFVCEGCPADAGSCASCEHTYAATRGTVELTELSVSVAGPVRGSLTDAYLAEVYWSADTLVPGGRGVCVDLWAFDAIMDAPGSW